MIPKRLPLEVLQAGAGMLTQQQPRFLEPEILSGTVPLAMMRSVGLNGAQMQFQVRPEDLEKLKKQIQDSINKLGDPSPDVREKAKDDISKALRDRTGSEAYKQMRKSTATKEAEKDPDASEALKGLDKEFDVRESTRKSLDKLDDPSTREGASAELARKAGWGGEGGPAEKEAFRDEVSRFPKEAKTPEGKAEAEAAAKLVNEQKNLTESKGFTEFNDNMKGVTRTGIDLGNPAVNKGLRDSLEKLEDDPKVPKAIKDVATKAKQALKDVMDKPKDSDIKKLASLLEDIQLLFTHMIDPMEDTLKKWADRVKGESDSLKKDFEDYATEVLKKEKERKKKEEEEKKEERGMLPPPTPTLGVVRLRPRPPIVLRTAIVTTRPPSGGLLSAALGLAPVPTQALPPTIAPPSEIPTIAT